MKKALSIITLVILTLSSYGQQYQPLPSDSAIWVYLNSGYQSDCYFSKYEMQGDTIINGTVWQKTYLQVAKTLYPGQFPCSLPTQYGTREYVGCLRNDTLNRQVYYIAANDTSLIKDTLLYNFNLHLGDTFIQKTYIYNTVGYDTLIVTQVKMESIGANYYKSFWVKLKNNNIPCGEILLIEGVGSSNGLLPIPFFCGETSIQLMCFVKKDFVNYSNSWKNDCASYLVSIKSENLKNLKNIYPNPASNLVNVQSELTIAKITLFTILGESVLSVQNASTIDVSSLQSGCYFMQVTTQNNSSTTSKLIVNH